MVNILIFRSDKIGDLLLNCPAIITIKKSFKQANITLVASENNYKYAKSLNLFDEIYVFPKKNFFKKIKFILKLSKKNYDYIFIFDGKERSVLASIFVKSKLKIALTQKIRFYYKIFKIKFVIDDDNTNLNSVFQKMLFVSQINKKISYYNFISNKEDNNFSKKIPINKYIQIHLDEKWFNYLYIKSYTNINPTFNDFTDFLNTLSKKSDVLITTGLVDLELVNKLNNSFFEKVDDKIFYKKNDQKSIYLINKPSLDDLESLFRNSKTTILCHPGIIHIASSLNIKIIDIIEKDKEFHYKRWTLHMNNYNSIYRSSFNSLKEDIIKKIQLLN